MRIFQILEFNRFDTGSVHQMFQAAVGLRERGHEVTMVSRPDVGAYPIGPSASGSCQRRR